LAGAGLKNCDYGSEREEPRFDYKVLKVRWASTLEDLEMVLDGYSK
jgi:hypothetical protein